MRHEDKCLLIEDAAEWAALEPAWRQLWERCPSATPFQSPAWLLPWWQAFHPGRLAVLAVQRGPRLLALAPLYLESGPLGNRLLPAGIGVSDYLDVLVDPEAAPAGVRLTEMLGQIDGWDRLELEELSHAAAARSLLCPRDCEECAAEQSVAPALALPSHAADPFTSVPPRQRRKLRMAQHRSARRTGVVELVDPGNLDTFLDHLVRLHAARWETRGEAGVLADERVRHFHAAALPALAAANLLRATLHVVDGQIAGAYYGLQHRSCAYAYLGGFDPAFAHESPGTVLLADAIASAHRNGATEFHFLRGSESYKYRWGAMDRKNIRRSFIRKASEHEHSRIVQQRLSPSTAVPDRVRAG